LPSHLKGEVNKLLRHLCIRRSSLSHLCNSSWVWSANAWWMVAAAFALLALLAIWQVWICEGAHLGPRFVVWLYDLTAKRYDHIKSYDPDWERRFLGEPVEAAVTALHDAQILDVGAGTGRLLRALPPWGSSDVRIVCVEPSQEMVRVGRKSVQTERARWVRGWAPKLPFTDEHFDLVVCIEVLEFTPDPRSTLKELVRVLRPGGWLLVTNRIGWQAPLILGRTFRRSEFSRILEGYAVEDVRVYPWQVDYDLAWARKRYPD
jgi:SAM-dependent methyltransferase